MASPAAGRRNARKGTGRPRSGRLEGRAIPTRKRANPPERPSREGGGVPPIGTGGPARKGRRPHTQNRPAAAVIPAPVAYIKVVAVKKLVVEPWAWLAGPPHRVHWSGRAFPSGDPHALHWAWWGTRTFTLKKLECSKQAFARIR